MLFLTKHAEDRMAERSIPISTVEAVIQHGDAYFIGGAWVWQFMGYRVVVDEAVENIMTVYETDRIFPWKREHKAAKAKRAKDRDRRKNNRRGAMCYLP